MTPEELLDFFRSQIHDVVEPYLWSDDEALRYMNLAYVDFVREVGGLRDSTSDMTQLVLPAGEKTYELNRRIVKVLNARRVADGRPVDVLSPQDHEAVHRAPVPGPVRALVLGEGESTVRVLDTPVVDTEVALVVRRLPLERVTVKTDAFEIRDEHVPHLVLGMQRWAFLKDDPDTYDKQRSDRSQAAFLAEAAKAKAEYSRANHVPRPVQYGGL